MVNKPGWVVLASAMLVVLGAMPAGRAAAPAQEQQAAPAQEQQHGGTSAIHVPGCPPPPETKKGPSSITATGPCAFELTGEATCSAEYDDLLLEVARPGAKKGTELMFFINVERYVGPKLYKPPNDMWVSLKDGAKMYRWSTNQYEATVGPGSKYVTFKDVRLEAEPILTGCVGPQTNYQCDGRDEDNRFMTTTAIVSGTIYCKKAPPPKRAR